MTDLGQYYGMTESWIDLNISKLIGMVPVFSQNKCYF